MTSLRVRRGIPVCGAVALIMLVSACSSGGEKLSVGGPRPTHRSDGTSTTEASTKPRAAKKSKPRSATSTTRRRASGTTTRSGVYVPLATTQPSVFVPPPPTTETPTTRDTPTTSCIPKPYDPSQAIDLGCSPGVTPAEQARAEQLIRDSLRDLPKYDNPNTAFADGYRSIGDAVTGDEHYIKWAYLSDGRILDSQHPESLVYEIRNGRQRLVAAMYMMELGDTFADVPDVGGPLTQWHVHNNLCLVDDPSDPLRKYVTLPSNGICPPGSSKATATPMIHVWIVKNACGPFASLEGIGAGQVPPGETRHCDTAHGSR